MPSVRLLVGSPPVGTSDTGLRPPLWAPSQLCGQVSSPLHDVPSIHTGYSGAVAAVATFCSPWGPSTLSSTEGSLK